MKKVFKVLIFIVLTFTIGIFNAKADYTIDFSNDDNNKRNEDSVFPLGTYYRITNDNKNVYCYQPYVSYGYSSNLDQFNYGNCSSNPSKAKQLSYVLANGYGSGSNKYSTGSDKYNDYYATQLAIWYFGDRTIWDYSIYPSDYFNNLDLNNKTYSGSSDNIITTAINLINDANLYAEEDNAVASISFDVSNINLNITNDRNYYISSAITINGNWVRDNVEVNVTGIDGVFLTKNKNATTSDNDFNIGDVIYVKVPVEKVTGEKQIELNIIAASKIGNSGAVQVCENIAFPYYQKMVNYNEEPEKLSDSLKLSVSLAKTTVIISKQDIVGSSEVKGATLVIKKGNTEVLKWESDGTEKKISLDIGEYTLEETIAPAGYKLNPEKITFKVNNNGTITIDDNVVDKVVMKNEPIYVTISKLGLDIDEQLIGAALKITDKEGKLNKDLDGKSLTWVTTSDKEKFHLGEGTYYLTEEKSPVGYIKSDKKIEFIVDKNGTITIGKEEVKEVVMVNDPLYVYISKRSINGKTELSGATLNITNEEGTLDKDLDGKNLTWVSTTKVEKFHLAPGKYILTEIKAPKGYELSDAIIEFTITEDNKILYNKQEAEDNMIVFKNTPEPEPVQTGSALLYVLFVGIITAGVVTFIVYKKKND